MSRPGPFCPACAHDYARPPAFAGWCPYCGVQAAPVVEKPFYEVSKSAIEKWGLPGDPFGCPMRFFFRYVMKLPEPKSPELDFGIIGHGMGETYYATGAHPQVNSLDPHSVESRAALSLLGGIPHMPPPTLPGLLVESEFHYEFEGVRFGGYRDVWAPLTPTYLNFPPNEMRFSGGVGASFVGDWKFVSRGSFKGYTPTPEKLANDLQANIEAFDDVRRGAVDVHLNWVYMPRGERLGKPVRALIHPDTIVPRMREIADTARKMGTVIAESKRRTIDPREMETRPSACNAYNRPCPRLDRCPVSNESRIGAMIMQNFSPAPGTPGGLDALVASQPWTPPGAAPPAPSPPAPSPPNPNALYWVTVGGKRYDNVPYGQLEAAVKSGATVGGPMEAAPPPAFANPGAAVNPPPAPVTTGPAPAPAAAQAPVAAAGKRGRKSAQPATPEEVEIDNNELLDAFNGVFRALRLPIKVVANPE